MRSSAFLVPVLLLSASCTSESSFGGADAGAAGHSLDAGGAGGGNNIGLGGAGDFGYFRRLLDEGIVPTTDDFDAAGFFHEHHLPLPPPACSEQVCAQAMLAAMPGLVDSESYSMLHIGLNTPVTVDPEDRPPLTLAVVVDVSGSMAAADKIDFVRAGLATLIDRMKDDDQLAIVTYSNNAETAAALGPVGGRRAQLHGVASGLSADGGTNLYAGLELGYQLVQGDYDLSRQNRVILLSDGQPTSGITSESEIISMSSGYNADGLGITTIGLGTAFNAPLMRGLSEQGHGNHYFLEHSDAIDEVFIEELSYFAIPVAFDVKLDVSAGSHYLFGAAYGSSFWKSSDVGGGVEVPSVFVAHRTSDDDVHEGDGGVTGRRGGGSALLLRLVPKEGTPEPEDNNAQVAVIDVSFRAPGSETATTDQVIVNHPFWMSPPAAGYFDSPDPANTAKTLVMLELYRAIEAACSHFHSAEGTVGLTRLARAEAVAADYNDEVMDVDIGFDLELVQKLAEVMKENGAQPPADPGIPADPWPVD